MSAIDKTMYSSNIHKYFLMDKFNLEEQVILKKLISHFETDLYKNAVVPIALAHRYTAISLAPGGHVLDILTKQSLHRK